MVNQMLTEMDGFRKEELIFVVATTNFLESVDTALLRPGRFELHIQVPYPNKEDRKEIFRDLYSKIQSGYIGFYFGVYSSENTSTCRCEQRYLF